MPQRDQLFEWRNIWDNVTLGPVRGEKDAAAYAHVSELLERYGLASFAKKRPCQLSGGMRQRCALIRTLATEPEILLLDEPFSALDYQTRLAVSADIWRIMRREGKTALLVTHDIAEAVSMSDRVVVLSRRPAVVKAELDMGALRPLPPMERRDTPEFHRYSIRYGRSWTFMPDIRLFHPGGGVSPASPAGEPAGAYLADRAGGGAVCRVGAQLPAGAVRRLSGQQSQPHGADAVDAVPLR